MAKKRASGSNSSASNPQNAANLPSSSEGSKAKRAERKTRLTREELADRAKALQTLYAELREVMLRGVYLAKHMGDILREVKGGLPHGEYGPWVRENCKGWSERSA